MNNKQINKKLIEETNPATELRDETWNKITKKLFSSKVPKVKNNRKRRIITGVSVAAVIAFIFFGMTGTGQAMIQSLKEMFIEEKQQEIEIEGHKEETDVHLETNEELRYIIYIDESFYKLVKGETSDRIVPKQELPDKYPEVLMEITRKEDTTTEEVVESIKQTLTTIDMEVNQEENVNTPIKGVVIKGIGVEYTNEFGKTGHQWDTPIHRYYVTETDNGQLFVIKQLYFLEAAEGHGVRLNSMLESFKIVK